MHKRSHTPTSLTRSAVSGAFWLSGARWVMRAASAATTLILAYLLGPEEYGLVAVAMVIASMIFVGNFGLTAAAIQRPGRTDRQVLDIAWTADKLVFNSAIAVAMLLGADALAALFHSPELAPVVRLLAAVPVLRIIENNALIVFTRRLDYRSRFLLELAESLTTLLLVVPLAFLWQNVWAYVVAYVVGATARSIASYALYPRRPRVFWNAALGRELFRFGRWMVGLRVLELLRDQLAQLVVAAGLGPTSLSFYQVGSRFSLQILTDAYQTSHKVLFPIYARAQGDTARLRRGHATVLLLALVVTAPIAASMIALAAPTIVLVLGTEWAAAASVVQVLAVAGMLRVVIGSSHPLFRGQGHASYEFLQNLLYFVVLLLGLVLLPKLYGFVGAAVAVLLAEAMQLPFWLVLLRKSIALSPGRVLDVAWLPLAGGALAVVLQRLIVDALSGSPALMVVVCSAVGGVAAYTLLVAAALRLLRPDDWAALVRLARELRRRRARSEPA